MVQIHARISITERGPSMFAYGIRAELNNDGTYRVELFDVDAEIGVVTTIERASIRIEHVPDEVGITTKPMLSVKMK